MQSRLFHKYHTDKQHGFTLVEMLVVIPVALLSVAALISLMVALVGDVMVAGTRASNVYELQDTMDRIEADSRISTAFMSTFSQLPSPQGRDGGTAAFSASSPNNDLILSMPATTLNPFDGERRLIYYDGQPNTCASGATQVNRTLTVRIVYFTTDNGNGTKTLWRRTVVPPWTTTAGNITTVCNAPWQRDSCPIGSTLSATCQTFDEKMLSSITNFAPTYYTATGAVTTDARSATSISISITQGQQVAGEVISSTSTSRVSRTNTTTAQIPTVAPVISINNPTINTMNHPLLTSFIWDTVPHADYYSIRYRIGAGAWVYPADQTANTFQVTAARPLNVINIEVTAKNDMGNSPVGTLNYTKPLWTTANLQGAWKCYSGGGVFPCPSYTISTAGVVLLRGLIVDGAMGSTMFTLPAQLRPNKRIIYQAMSDGNPKDAGVDVLANGDVMWDNTGNNGFISLDNIRFLSQSDASPTWLTPTYTSPWVAFNDSQYGVPQYTKDSLGRTHIYGAIMGGNPLTTNPMITLAAGYQPTDNSIWPNQTSNYSAASYQINNTRAVISRGIGLSGFMTLASMYHPTTSAQTYTALPMENSWVNYNTPYVTNNYAQASYTKSADGIVSLRGLIRYGNTTNEVVIGRLPAGYCPDIYGLVFLTQGLESPGYYEDQIPARIDIRWIAATNNCTVSLYNNVPPYVANGYLSLDGIHFMQER